MSPHKYPIGIQTFSELITNGYLYIDKTEYVYRFAHNAKYNFLSRPRRFGKSLLTSTLRAYFEGRKELFEGLAISQWETEWTQHPVLHFDISRAKHVDKETLESMLATQLERYEKIYDSPFAEKKLNDRLGLLIERAYQVTGQKAVVLIDEYDAPLLDVIHEEKNLPALRDVMRNFYSPLKACDPYLRFVFLTGITKFSQLSIFSELNNIDNISMTEEYAAICGITEEELLTQMDADLDYLAGRLKVSKAEAFAKLKANYDGYHFTWPSPDIYNPYSLLNAFHKGKIDSYWFSSGTPTYLIEMLRKFDMNVIELDGEIEARACDFDAPTEQLTQIEPLLYQSGYYTIKDGFPELESYVLGIPNREVRLGLMNSLIPYYLTPNTRQTSVVLLSMARCLQKDDMDGVLRVLQVFLRTVPYTPNTQHEGHYQQMLYVIFSLLGYYADVEVHTVDGRVDVVMCTATTLYLIEVKLNQSAEAAMQQIDLKDYADRFALCGLPIVKVGINFDSETRTIADWEIRQVSRES